MHLDGQFIRDVLSGSFFSGVFPTNARFQIDSREVEAQDVFVALQGVRYDGHTFVVDAVQNGAAGIIVSAEQLASIQEILRKKGWKNIAVAAVKDTRKALISLASEWRNRFSIPVVGITGSVGKTTTKESFAHVLKVAGIPYIASRGNQNTQIGVALNILRLRADHKVALLEMGISKRGEMARLAAIARPTIAVITNIGHSHMEGLGSLQDISQEKRDIFKYLSEKDIGIVNGDQELLSAVSYPHPVIKFGMKTTNQIQARKVRVVEGRTRCTLKIYKQKYDVVLPKPHEGIVTNALVSGALAHILSLRIEDFLEAVQQPVNVPGRFEVCRLKGARGVMINDCYNANPESMKAALQAFQSLHTSAEKIAILGDMLELGVNSPFWHRQIGRFFRKAPSVKKVILVGNLVEWIEKTVPLGVQVHRVETWQEALDVYKDLPKAKERMVLVKGSHGIGLSGLVKECTE